MGDHRRHPAHRAQARHVKQFGVQFLQPPLGLSEHRFGCLALGDVDDRGQHHQAFVGLDRVQPDLHREFAAVLFEPIKLAAGAHRPGARLSVKSLAQSGMVFPVAGRNERFDGLAEKLVSRVAEHALGLGIDHDDRTGSLHHDHRAGRRLDDQPEPLFGGKRRLRLMAPIHPFAAIDCVVVRAVAGVAVAIGVVLSVSTTHSPPRHDFDHRQPARAHRNPLHCRHGLPTPGGLAKSGEPSLNTGCTWAS